MLIGCQRYRASFRVFHREEAPVEAALLYSHSGAALRFQSKAVYILAAEAFKRGNQISADTLRHLEMLPAQMQVIAIDARAIRAHRHTRHALDAAANHQMLHTGEDAHRRKVHRLKARAAEAVERDTSCFQRPISSQHGGAGNVSALLASLRDTAHDHIVYVVSVNAGLFCQAVECLRE